MLTDGTALVRADARDALPRVAHAASFGVLLTDPPYVAWRYVAETRARGRLGLPQDLAWVASTAEWMAEWFPAARQRVRPDGAGWVFTNQHYLGFYLRLAAWFDWPWRAVVPCAGPEEEVLLYFGPPLRAAALAGVVDACQTGNRFGQGKPVPLLRVLLAASPPGPVLEPFMGSGTTLEAARREGREALGIERDEALFAGALARLCAGADAPARDQRVPVLGGA